MKHMKDVKAMKKNNEKYSVMIFMSFMPFMFAFELLVFLWPFFRSPFSTT